MIQLNAGNVLLKPSHRKQLMTWLRRALKIGERLGKFVLNVSMVRTGRSYEVRASVRDSAGEFSCRTRSSDWATAVREMVRIVVGQLHTQWVSRAYAA